MKMQTASTLQATAKTQWHCISCQKKWAGYIIYLFLIPYLPGNPGNITIITIIKMRRVQFPGQAHLEQNTEGIEQSQARQGTDRKDLIVPLLSPCVPLIPSQTHQKCVHLVPSPAERRTGWATSGVSICVLVYPIPGYWCHVVTEITRHQPKSCLQDVGCAVLISNMDADGHAFLRQRCKFQHKSFPEGMMSDNSCSKTTDCQLWLVTRVQWGTGNVQWQVSQSHHVHQNIELNFIIWFQLNLIICMISGRVFNSQWSLNSMTVGSGTAFSTQYITCYVLCNCSELRL